MVSVVFSRLLDADCASRRFPYHQSKEPLLCNTQPRFPNKAPDVIYRYKQVTRQNCLQGFRMCRLTALLGQVQALPQPLVKTSLYEASKQL